MTPNNRLDSDARKTRAGHPERCDWFTAFGGIRTTLSLMDPLGSYLVLVSPTLTRQKPSRLSNSMTYHRAERFLMSAAGKGGNQKIRT